MPTPLRVGQREIACRLPHLVITAGIAEAYNNEPADSVPLRVAFLGYCLQDAPERFSRESWLVYGQRIMDWLTGEGVPLKEVLDYSDEVLAEAFRSLPRPPTEAEVGLGESRSTGGASTEGSGSPGSGPGTPGSG